MYFEEKMIDGVMCFRTTPNGEWRPFDIKELSRRYAAALSDDGWTYCDDRLPEESNDYVVSVVVPLYKRSFVHWSAFNRGWDIEGEDSDWTVIAWRPLPAPAKGRDV